MSEADHKEGRQVVQPLPRVDAGGSICWCDARAVVQFLPGSSFSVITVLSQLTTTRHGGDRATRMPRATFALMSQGTRRVSLCTLLRLSSVACHLVALQLQAAAFAKPAMPHCDSPRRE